MTNEQTSPFKVVRRTPEVDPRTYLDETVTVKDQHRVVDNADYIRQIADEGGMHSCLLTSVLNGLVGLGLLTQDEAISFQDSFRTTNNHFFKERDFGDGRLLQVLAYPVGRVVQALEEKVGKKFSHKTIGVSKMEESDIRALVLQKLTQNELLVGGDAAHAVLVVGYIDGGDILEIIDPYRPESVTIKSTDQFVTDMKVGEPWLTVLSK